MAYGKGMGRLMRERGIEQATEKKRYERELAAAEEARRKESSSKSMWGTGLSLLGGALLGPVGLVAGKALGTFGADLAHRSEDVKISTDVGKFGVSQKGQLEDINRQLEAADKGQFWKDVADVGTTALTAFTLGGGSLTDTSTWKDVSMTKFGGTGAGATDTGMGLFNIGGKGSQSMWNQWLSKKSVGAGATKAYTGSSLG
jgi:hypothetical protein